MLTFAKERGLKNADFFERRASSAGPPYFFSYNINFDILWICKEIFLLYAQRYL